MPSAFMHDCGTCALLTEYSTSRDLAPVSLWHTHMSACMPRDLSPPGYSTVLSNAQTRVNLGEHYVSALRCFTRQDRHENSLYTTLQPKLGAGPDYGGNVSCMWEHVTALSSLSELSSVESHCSMPSCKPFVMSIKMFCEQGLLAPIAQL